jgi:hypothetical protein
MTLGSRFLSHLCVQNVFVGTSTDTALLRLESVQQKIKNLTLLDTSAHAPLHMERVSDQWLENVVRTSSCPTGKKPTLLFFDNLHEFTPHQWTLVLRAVKLTNVRCVCTGLTDTVVGSFSLMELHANTMLYATNETNLYAATNQSVSYPSGCTSLSVVYRLRWDNPPSLSTYESSPVSTWTRGCTINSFFLVHTNLRVRCGFRLPNGDMDTIACVEYAREKHMHASAAPATFIEPTLVSALDASPALAVGCSWLPRKEVVHTDANKKPLPHVYATHNTCALRSLFRTMANKQLAPTPFEGVHFSPPVLLQETSAFSKTIWV